MRSMRQTRPTALLAALLSFSLFVVACGGDDDTSSDASENDSGGDSSDDTAGDSSDDTAGDTTADDASGHDADLQDWAYEVEYLAADGTAVESVDWTPLPVDELTEPWNICAAIVHLKDSYWTALDYGVADEATRTGTNLSWLAAGVYTGLATQLNQPDYCVARVASGVTSV